MSQDLQLRMVAKGIVSSGEVPKFLVMLLDKQACRADALVYDMVDYADSYEEALAVMQGYEVDYRKYKDEDTVFEICLGFDDIPVVAVGQFSLWKGELVEIFDPGREEDDWFDDYFFYQRIQDLEFWLKGLEDLLYDGENHMVIKRLTEMFPA